MRFYKVLLLVIWTAIFLINVSNSFAVTLQRGPYIQDLTTNSVTIVWTTDVASNSQVQYGLSMPYTNITSDTVSVTLHAVTLTGLTKASIYYYQISSAGQTLSGDLTFHSGKDSTFNSFMFVAMGDHRSNPTAHSDVAQRVKIIDPELIIDTGDLTSDGNTSSTWDSQFFTPEKDVMSRCCMFPSIGNHEGNATNYLNFFYLPSASSGSERYYSFDYANAHFTILDTTITYTTGSAQYNWLVSDLSANQTKKWIFVAFHNPPYSSSSHGSDLTIRNTLCPLFEQYGVDIVFNGHDHNYERSYANGIYYIVTGGGGAPLYANGYNSWTQFSASAYHCCKIEINNSVLNFQAIKPDGSVLDSVSIYPTSISYWALF